MHVRTCMYMHVCCSPEPMLHACTCMCVVAPMVQFTSSCRHVSEPLSNSVLDRSTLTLHLVRSGDISLPSNVTYAAIDESAKAGEDFDLTSGMITFTQGQNTSELVIVILANHKRRYNTSFAVELSSMTSDLTTTIGTNNSVAVLIEDVGVSGPYFPVLPQLCNVAEGGGVEACAPQQLYFDLPLTCITVSVTRHDVGVVMWVW